METLTRLSAKIFTKNQSSRNLWYSKSLLGRSDICFSRSLNFSVQFYRSLSLQNRAIRLVAPSHLAFDPEVSTGLENAEGGTDMQRTQTSKTMHVRFLLQKECMFGEQFFLVGDDPALGSWNPSNAIPLNWSDGHVWSIEVGIPVGLAIQFKFIFKASTGDVLWQPGPDRIFRAWETNSSIIIVEDWENAEFQKIIEDQMIDQNGEQGFNAYFDPVVAGGLTHLTGELMLNVNKDVTFPDSIALSEDKPISVSSNNEFINADTKKELNMKDCVGSKEEEPVSQNNLRTLPSKNQRSEEDEATSFSYEEGPVLVPGLTPLPLEEAIPKEFRKSVNDGCN